MIFGMFKMFKKKFTLKNMLEVKTWSIKLWLRILKLTVTYKKILTTLFIK